MRDCPIREFSENFHSQGGVALLDAAINFWEVENPPRTMVQEGATH